MDKIFPINRYDNIILIIIWFIIFLAFPFSITQALNLPAKPLMGIGIFILLILIKVNRIKVRQTLIWVFLVELLFSFLFIFLHNDSAYVNFCFQIIFPLIIYIAISSKQVFEIFSLQFLRLMALMGVLSVICFFLCLLINYSPYSIFVNPDGRTGYNFIISFTNTLFDIGSVKILRPAGYFDEPGTLAFYLIVALLINDLTIKNKNYQKTFIIAGMFTLSLAFYFILLVYLSFYMTLKKFYYSSFSVFLVSFILGFGYFKLLPEQQEIIYGYTFGRIESIFIPDNSSTYFQGDNRSDLVEVSIEAIKDSPLIGQGISYASNENSKFFGEFMGANFFGTFGIHGIIGGIVFSLHVFYYFLLCIKQRYLFNVPQKCGLIYFILILQRPDFIGGILPYVAVLLLIFATINYERKAQNINNNGSI